MGTRKATLIRYSGPGRDGRFLAFVMRLLPTDSDRERLNSNKSCLRIAREFIPRPDVAAETMIERIDPPGPGGPPYPGGLNRPTRLGTTTPIQKAPRGPDDRGASPSIGCRPPSLVG